MEQVIVERSFDEAVEFEDLQAQGDKVSWCLDQHRVRFLRSYLSSDKKRMICVYEAPDAESVRIANRQAEVPFDCVWTATLHGADE
ncbi:MAG TPA: DUF4242 domain-containing protein [Blastocatellia bacterium]|nr:DUF4242 domain-containing protein [Blastocatellia bacterium]